MTLNQQFFVTRGAKACKPRCGIRAASGQGDPFRVGAGADPRRSGCRAGPAARANRTAGARNLSGSPARSRRPPTTLPKQADSARKPAPAMSIEDGHPEPRLPCRCQRRARRWDYPTQKDFARPRTLGPDAAIIEPVGNGIMMRDRAGPAIAARVRKAPRFLPAGPRNAGRDRGWPSRQRPGRRSARRTGRCWRAGCGPAGRIHGRRRREGAAERTALGNRAGVGMSWSARPANIRCSRRRRPLSQRASNPRRSAPLLDHRERTR